MSESPDYTPAPHWQGHDFKSAYKAYDANAGRGYAQAKAAGVKASALVPDFIETDSSCPGAIDTDFSGSMGGQDATICSKFPYFEHEVRKEYMGADAEFSFGAICDTGDEFPLQITKFAKGAALKTALTSLIHASGGTGPGDICEAHGLAMLYRIHNTRMPKALTKPPYIIITDEMPYGHISPQEAERHAKVVIEKAMKIESIIEEVMHRYSMYVILKPYEGDMPTNDTLPPTAARVKKRWEGLIGVDRIALLPDPNRVVDVMFGILAREAGKIDYFREELEARQLPDVGGKQKVETVAHIYIRHNV